LGLTALSIKVSAGEVLASTREAVTAVGQGGGEKRVEGDGNL